MNLRSARVQERPTGEHIMDQRANELELKVLFDISRVIGQALELDRALETVPAILAEYLSMTDAQKPQAAFLTCAN